MPIRIVLQTLVVFMLLAGSAHCASSPSPGSVLVNEDKVRQVVAEFIKNRTAHLGIELNIRKIEYKGNLTLPVGSVEYEVVAPRQWEGWGHASLALIIRVDGHVKKNIPIWVEVEALSDMVVTTRQLEQGQVIRASDVALQKRDLATVGGKLCSKIEDVVGKRLKASVRGNMVLRSDQVERVPIIKNGQLVTIVLENELIRITASGRSKGAGAAGDLVVVQNLASHKDIPARVVDASTVKVEF